MKGKLYDLESENLYCTQRDATAMKFIESICDVNVFAHTICHYMQLYGKESYESFAEWQQGSDFAKS